jgi:Lrp/AsnC family transcriptional regulator, leucine-responsive regulatory protein
MFLAEKTLLAFAAPSVTPARYPATARLASLTPLGELSRIPELAAEIPQVSECHRITGEDCFLRAPPLTDE